MKKVLIVDDNKDIRKVIKRTLEELQYDVFEAKNGVEAIDMYKKINPFFVTMDINMPLLNGLKAAEIIKEYDKDALIIICSSMLFIPHYKKLAIDAGACSLLSKPFTESDLFDAIANLLTIKECDSDEDI